MTNSAENSTKKNDAQWDSYYLSYQKDTLVPGVKYPNEHLVRFLHYWKEHDPAGSSRGKIIELGFGTIANIAMMCDLGFDVAGYEVSDEAVRRGTLALEDRNLSDRVRLDTFSGGKIPAEDSSADLIVGLQSVYYNLDQEAFAGECARVVKPGGLIMFSFFSPAHEYMRHIDGEPGGIVRFSEDHPNPRLCGLDLFVYQNRNNFSDTYGKYFDIEIGIDEYNFLPTFQSWYYLYGQAKNSDQGFKLTYPIAAPAAKPSDDVTAGAVDHDAISQKNIAVWDAYHASLPPKAPFSGARYPVEYITRFIAGRQRLKLGDYFSKYEGHEESLSLVDKSSVLEINPDNPANLLMSKGFGYQPFGVTWSAEVFSRTRDFLARDEFMGSFSMDSWDGKQLPFETKTFDALFSYKAAYYQSDQARFVKECARVSKENAEIFFFYIAPDHTYSDHVEAIGKSLFRFRDDHPNPLLVGATIFIGEPNEIENLWSEYFDVSMKFFRYDDHPSYSSFNIVSGSRNGAGVS